MDKKFLTSFIDGREVSGNNGIYFELSFSYQIL